MARIGLVAVLAAGATLCFGIAGAHGSNGDPHAVKTYVGYADTLRSPPFTPSPWMGDPGVTFRGTSSDWDAGAIMLVNPSRNPLTVDDVNVLVGVVPFDLWAPYPIVVPGKGTLILTQTAFFDFDTSDTAPGPCNAPSTIIPVVNVTVGAGHLLIHSYNDNGQVLNTGGIDPAVCGGLEGHDWQRVTPADDE